jgi:hypothetical protein
MIRRVRQVDTPLERTVRRIARQLWRRRSIYCAFQFGLASLALVLAFTAVLKFLPHDGAARYTVLGVFVLIEAIAAWLLLMRPLRQAIDLQKAALYLDEKHPELENRVVSAIEFNEALRGERPAWFITRLHVDSWRAVKKIPFNELMDSRRAVQWSIVGALAWLGVFGCIGLYRNLWLPDIEVLKSVNVFRSKKLEFAVEPGSVRVRRGESPVVRVLWRQSPQAASIRWQTPGGQWQTAAMEEGASARVHYHQFANVQSDVLYQIRIGETGSEVYRIAVWTSAEVESIDLTYRYPDYLKQPAAEVPHAGDITAVVGTQVGVAVTVNKPLKSAQLTLGDGSNVALREVNPTRWEGALPVARNDVYRVNLTDPEGLKNQYVPEYRITAQPDNPPEVTIDFPRGDMDVTSIDELPFEFKVDDDFGLENYGIQIEVAGREPVRVPLKSDGAETSRTAAGRHTLMLETMNLSPGDLVTWVVWANDRKPGREAFETLGYPYFLEIRPFRREFEEAVSDQSSQEQQQQQQGQNGNNPAMSQKEVLIATWNLRREAKTLKQSEFEDRLKRIKEAQGRVKQQLAERGLAAGANSAAQKGAIESIDKALEALDGTKWPEPSGSLSEAIRHMQTAHQQLLKARPNRSQIQMARNQSGNQGQNQQSNQREINELELRRNRNFYEQERRVQQQREATQAALNDLKDLARRQQMINEEINKLISEMEKADPQRREELARQLERLREEERRALAQLDQAQRNMANDRMDRQQAGETNRALQQARQQMTRSLDNMQRGDVQQARAAGSRASQALNEAGQALERLSRDGAAQRLAELQKRVREMGEREDGILKRIGELRDQRDTPGSLRRDENVERKHEETLKEKDALARDFRDALQDAANLSKGAEASQELMARRLGDWLRQTSREEIPENIEKARRLVEAGIWDPAMEAENQIREKLAQAEKNLANVAEGAVADDLEGMRKALEELRRMREAEEQRRNGAQANAAGQRPGARPEDQPSGERSRQAGERSPQPGDRSQQPGEQSQQPGERSPQPGEQSQQQPGGGRPDQRNSDPNRRGADPNQQGANPDQRNSADQQNANSGQRGPNPRDPNQRDANQRNGERNQAGVNSNPRDAQANATDRQAGERQANAGRSAGASDRATADANRGGGWRDWMAPRSDEEMRRFMEQDYRDWIDRIRDAEATLPNDSGARQNLGRAREAISELRRNFRGATSHTEGPPRFDLVKQMVGVPLGMAAEELERQIRKREDAEKLILTDEDAVPEKYRKRVANYYEALSEDKAK